MKQIPAHRRLASGKWFLALLLSTLIGCNTPSQDVAIAPEAPRTTIPTPVPQPESINSVPDEPKVKAVLRPVRLAAQVPGTDEANNRRQLKQASLSVTIDGKKVTEPATARTMADAREGFSVLLLVNGKNKHLHSQGAKLLLKEMTFRDRVAVGTITPQGFQSLIGFSADPQAAQAALDTVIQEKQAKESVSKLPILESIQKTIPHFPGGTLPPQRVLVLAGVQDDERWMRTSQRKRLLTRLQRELIENDIRLLVADTTPSDDAPTSWKTLAEATGGTFIQVHPPTDDPFDNPLKNAYRSLNDFLRNRVIVDVSVPEDWMKDSVQVSVAISSDHYNVVNQRTVSLIVKEQERLFVDASMPPAPDIPRLPGNRAWQDIQKSAEEATASEEKLEAAILWEMARKSCPENKDLERQAHRTAAQLKALPPIAGTIQYGRTAIPIDIPIHNHIQKAPALWQALTGVANGLEQFVRPRTEAWPDTEAPILNNEAVPIHQVVLHRCAQNTADDCVKLLMSERTMTHIVVDTDGTLIQIADLGMAVNGTKSEGYDQIAVHVVLPDANTPLFQDPNDPKTWRLPRKRRTNVEVNGSFQNGWSLAMRQRHSIIALMNALTNQLPKIAPVFPIDMQRNPTFAALLTPSNHEGLMTHSNLDKRVSACPGPGLDLSRLNRSIAAWGRSEESLDLEDWVDELQTPGHAEHAITRFVSIEPIGVPILTEILREVPLHLEADADNSLLFRTIEALASHPSKPGGDPFVATINRLIATPPPLKKAQQNLIEELLQGLIYVGNHNHAPAINRWVGLWAKQDMESSTPIWRPMIRAALAALLVSADRPEHISQAIPLLKHEEDEIRAQAALLLMTHAPETIQSYGQNLSSDNNPWIRLLSTRMAPTKRWKILNALVGVIPIHHLAAHVFALWKQEPQRATLRWYRRKELTAADRSALRALFAQWKYARAVPALAQTLSETSGVERWMVLQTLREITGRDFGSSPAGWLQWRPKPNESKPKHNSR